MDTNILINYIFYPYNTNKHMKIKTQFYQISNKQNFQNMSVNSTL